MELPSGHFETYFAISAFYNIRTYTLNSFSRPK
jgi:hypothetical protein